MNQAIVRRSDSVPRVPARRPGLFERRLITPEDTTNQNIVLVDSEVGAHVEYHRVGTSESIYVLEGEFEIELERSKQILQTGDIVHFPAHSSHGLRCLSGPGQFLLVFAPTDVNVRNSAN